MFAAHLPPAVGWNDCRTFVASIVNELQRLERKHRDEMTTEWAALPYAVLSHGKSPTLLTKTAENFCSSPPKCSADMEAGIPAVAVRTSDRVLVAVCLQLWQVATVISSRKKKWELVVTKFLIERQRQRTPLVFKRVKRVGGLAPPQSMLDTKKVASIYSLDNFWSSVCVDGCWLAGHNEGPRKIATRPQQLLLEERMATLRCSLL